MNKKDFFNEIQRELCKGKSSCEFEASYVLWAKETKNNGAVKHLSNYVCGKFIFSDDKDSIIIRQLGYPYSLENDTVFTIDNSNFVYDDEYRIIIITSTLKHSDSKGFGITIKLQDIKIK